MGELMAFRWLRQALQEQGSGDCGDPDASDSFSRSRLGDDSPARLISSGSPRNREAQTFGTVLAF